MLKNPQDNPEIQQRVIVFLNRDQVDFLDKLGKDTLFSGKKKLPRTKILSGLVNLLMDLDINAKGISSLEELKARIKEKIGLSWPSTKELLTFKEKEDKEGEL